MRTEWRNFAAHLILVGTVHGDPRGYERTVKLLEYLRPELITVEISPFSVRYRAAHQEKWRRLLEAALTQLPEGARKHPAIRRVAAQIEMPFEWRAAHDYGGKAGIPWRPIDLSVLARRHLPLYEKELLTPDNLKQLWKTPGYSLEEQVMAAYRQARRCLRPPGWRPSPDTGGLGCWRERTVAARLRRLANGRRVVHLGGWQHVVSWEDGGSLSDLLKDLGPVRLLLDESDALAGQSPEVKSSESSPGSSHGKPNRFHSLQP